MDDQIRNEHGRFGKLNYPYHFDLPAVVAERPRTGVPTKLITAAMPGVTALTASNIGDKKGHSKSSNHQL
jgi:hypothetical protein